jgi:hypothetical protein
VCPIRLQYYAGYVILQLLPFKGSYQWPHLDPQ